MWVSLPILMPTYTELIVVPSKISAPRDTDNLGPIRALEPIHALAPIRAPSPICAPSPIHESAPIRAPPPIHASAPIRAPSATSTTHPSGEMCRVHAAPARMYCSRRHVSLIVFHRSIVVPPLDDPLRHPPRRHSPL
ncbi:MAG: hypothetical protein BWX86_00596 [Verrucomicrobia bacterium ADurb.Bin122]|nr:MAG: hypothetical protein BWX86_00596 [Verrucomicrobia bacterium ADurb.Bin122]